MISSPHTESPDALAASLKNTFRGGAQWPVDNASLAALVDLGLSNRQIADYFAVGADDVHRLRESYGFR